MQKASSTDQLCRKKPFARGFANQIKEQLSKCGAYTSFPMSLLLVVVESIVDVEFLCPCRVELNAMFSLFILIGPIIFAFTLMVLFLRPFKYFHGTFRCDKTKLDCAKAFLHCLIPPTVWVIIVFLDGRYLACAWTDWNGIYLYDMNIKLQWCIPSQSGRNATELQGLSHKYIGVSQLTGYIMVSALSAILLIIVATYDCCRNGNELQPVEYQEMGAFQPCNNTTESTEPAEP